MSLYSERLAHLKRELAEEIAKRRKKKKKFTSNQNIMINFINGVTVNAIFNLRGMNVTLKKGTADGGFRHILEKHYCKGCKGEISMLDILNMDLVIQRGLKLNNVGVSNGNNIVFNYKNRDSEHNVVLKEDRNKELVVSFYSID